MWRIAVCLIAALLILSASAQGDKPVANHIQGWGDIVNPDGDCDVHSMDDSISLTLPPKAHDYAAELERWNSPRVVTTVRSDFLIEIKCPARSSRQRRARSMAGSLTTARALY